MSLPFPLLPDDSPTGVDRLKLELTLTIGGTAHIIPGANIKNLDLQLRSYGFAGRLDFFLFDDMAHGGKEEDKLYADFIKNDLITIKLTVRAIRPDQVITESADPLTVSGLVIDKGLVDLSYRQVKTTPTLVRHYYIRFTDAAQHLWRQHFPCELYTKKTVKDVIDAHKPDAISITYDWTELTKQYPLLFLGHEPGSGKSSFYDFLIWFVDTRGGALWYDYAKQSLHLATEKPAMPSKVKLYYDDLAGFRVIFPEIVRHKVRILNSYTESTATKEIDQDFVTTPIRQDYLLDTPVSAQVDARETLEKARLILRQNELEIQFSRFPADPIFPGQLVDLSNSTYWSTVYKTLPKPMQGKSLRIYSLDINAAALDMGPDADHGLANAGYHVKVSALLELQAEKHVKLPPYKRPEYPRHVEGKIVSEVGADDELTYQIYQDPDTSVDQYKVKIPLWANQEIFVPFNPNLFPGHYYFPAYKTQRVLIAFDFQNAWLKRFLDWRPEGRLAADTQGNHLLVGKKPTNSTSIKHVYGEDKPEFQILRTHEKDVQTIHIKEGYMLIEVKEKK